MVEVRLLGDETMPVNLLNERELNNFLARLVFADEDVPVIKPENLRDISYVENNQEMIAKCMLMQWMKHRLRAYLTDQINVSFLARVTSPYSSMPQWVINRLSLGQEIYRFREEGIHSSLRDKIDKICYFLEQRAQKYIIKQLCVALQQGTSVKLQLAYLKMSNQYRGFEETYQLAAIWERAEERRKTHRFHRGETKRSILGIKKVMDLSDGYYVVQILTDEARAFEAQYMNNCLHRTSLSEAFHTGRKRYYSIRDAKGEPHVTIEVRDREIVENDIFEVAGLPEDVPDFAGGIIFEYEGKNNRQPIGRYIPYFQEFVLRGKFGFSQYSMRSSGLIYQDNRYYNLFDLPQGLVIHGDVNIMNMGLTELPDMSTITVEGDFYCGHNRLKSLKGAPRCVKGGFDCHDNELETLEGGPLDVGYGYFCGQNLLKTLKGCPNIINGPLHCSDNRLATIDYLPTRFTKAVINGNPVLQTVLEVFFTGGVPDEISSTVLYRMRQTLQSQKISSQPILLSPERNLTR